jgi:hypothetical protein
MCTTKWKRGAKQRGKKFGNRYMLMLYSFYNCTEFWKQNEVYGEIEIRKDGSNSEKWKPLKRWKNLTKASGKRKEGESRKEVDLALFVLHPSNLSFFIWHSGYPALSLPP